ncbi:DUF2809 domain-containing protein [candidate division KSB1 bacterium]|nr:DUF2809 domain-containing protein [candidate division KSB1 bacterium]
MNRSYRVQALIFCALFMGFAILSKLYRGPGMQFSAWYLGDVGIVASLYFALSAARTSWNPFVKGLAVFLFATAVELYQLSGIPLSWNLEGPVVHIFGTSWDVRDFIAYAAGLLIALAVDWPLKQKASRQRTAEEKN